MTFAPVHPTRGLLDILSGIQQSGGLLGSAPQAAPPPNAPNLLTAHPASAMPSLSMSGVDPSVLQSAPAPEVPLLPPTHKPSLTERLNGAFQNVQSTLFPARGDTLNPRKEAWLDAGLSLLSNSRGVIGVNGGNAPSTNQAIAQAIHAGRETNTEQNMQAQMQDLYREIGLPQNGDPAEDKAWVGKALPRLLAMGNYKAVQALSPFADRLFTEHGGAADPGKLYVNDSTKELRTFSTRAGVEIPKGWKPYNEDSGSSSNQTLWRDKNTNKYYTLPNNQTPESASLPGSHIGGRYVPETTAREQDVQTHTDRRFDTNTGRQSATSFNSDPDVKMIVKQAAIARQFQTIIGQARKGNAVASNSLISQMAALLDPGLQLRLGTIYYLKELDPSIEGKLATWGSRLRNGTWPKYQLDELETLVNEVQDANKRVYAARRTDFLQGVPGAAPWTPSEKVYFNNSDAEPTPTPGGAVPSYEEWKKSKGHP